MSENIRRRYNEYAATADPADFWSQVRRTRNGKPVDDAQIEMIVDAVTAALEIKPDDYLLDLCCGNGVLTDRIVRHCRRGLGVDFSDGLIDVAKRHFERPGQQDFLLADVREFANRKNEKPFTKALCYGSFMYLTPEAAMDVLSGIRRNAATVSKLLIGNLPDKSRLHDFYYENAYAEGSENDPESPLGMWRSEDEFSELAAATGWDAVFRRMPADFYASHYRFDAVLTPQR